MNDIYNIKRVGQLKILIYWMVSHLQPFVEPSHGIHNYFLPRYYAIVIPITLGVILMGVIGELVLYCWARVIVTLSP